MKVYTTSDIRNLVLIGHGGAGKTSLAAWMLFTSGATKKLGRVDDGSAVTDFDDEEIERKISLQTSAAHAEWKSKKLNLLDTPGYASFVADAKSAIAVADAGLLLVDATAGVEVITRRTFNYAQERELPLFFVVNKLDRENASFQRSLDSMQKVFGRAATPLQLPIGKEHDFAGAVDLISGKAFRYKQDGDGKSKPEEAPAEMADAIAEARSALVEMIAETDDSLMEAFFESGDLDAAQLATGLRSAVRRRKIFPVLCTSAAHGIGIQALLDLLTETAPAPGELGEAVGCDPERVGDDGNCPDEAKISRPVDSSQPLSLFVFKTIADPFAGRLSIFRVQSGTLAGGTSVVNVRTGDTERVSHPAILEGKQITNVDEMHAGDIGVLAKLKSTETSDTLSDAAHKIRYPAIEFPEPPMAYAVEPKSKGDEEKISNALHRLTEEDPVLRFGRDDQTHELLVSGTSQVHLEVALAKMKKKFGVDAVLKQPRVPYLETIKKKVARVQGRHKKQSGGRGQFGDCWIELEPLPRGQGFEFVDKIFGGSIPQNYRPAVEKGIREAATRGWLSGNPVIDFRVTLVDGSYHSVDSSEMAFKIAGSKAFQAAMDQAKPTILEPVMLVEIHAPEDCMGDIMGDLSSRRGKPQGMEAEGDYQVIRAQVPMKEMLTYASTLKALTSDRATYHMEFDHYHEVPAAIREEIIAEHKAKQAEGS